MIVRSENKTDREAVRTVNSGAFETGAEADLVDRLRKEAHPLISLVAEEEGQVVGHILFTPVSLTGHCQAKIMGLAPMAVTPERQRSGIGSALVREGLNQCRKQGWEAVVVLGHPGYYPRFGFRPASSFEIACQFEVPDEAFMALELSPGAFTARSGTIHYHPAFAEV